MTTSISIRQFKKEITKKYIKSSNNEIISMLKEGNIEDVVSSLLPLVIYIVDKFSYKDDSEFEELISVGNYGLMRGITQFNEDKSDNIISYCNSIIRFEILHYINKQRNIIKIPSPYYKPKTDVSRPKIVEVDDINSIDYPDEVYEELTFNRTEVEDLLLLIPNINYDEILLFLDYYLTPRITYRQLGRKHGYKEVYVAYVVPKILNKIKNNSKVKERLRKLLLL